MPDTAMKQIQTVDPELIAATEVKKLLKELKQDKSPGPDNIHPAMLKNLAEVLAEPMARLFNLTFQKAKIPTEWKIARVCAIHKKGDVRLAANYTPVSLASIICKLCGYVRRGILNHLKANQLLTDKQYGFIPGRNITIQLLNLLEDWTEAYDKGEEIDCVYLDFCKAFGKVQHNRLIVKLRSFQFHPSSIEWIQDFLYSRKQQVAVCEASSDLAVVTSGIPQGSVLGPILFLLFINDLPDTVENKLLLFADDTKIYSTNNLPTLQDDLNRLVHWTQKWLLTFNADKCKHLHLGNNPPSTALYLQNQALNIVKEEKDLGIIFEDSLHFHHHISEKI